ncbi:MAG TPA: response regulator [Burkholderiaceae bacterium]|nr:response regulator [Burkholderiaceae bacterium]
MSASRFVSAPPGVAPVVAAATAAPSEPRPEIRVAAFGLAHKFQRILEIVFRHARHNPYQFVIAPSRGPGDFDLALVDMTAKGGPEVAQTLRRLPEARPIVTVGRREDPARACDDLVLQRFALNLLGALNRAVERNLPDLARRGAAAFMRGAAALFGDLDPERVLGRRPRVLMVDPSPAVRRQLALALQQMGIEGEGVATAREALEALALRRYELVVTESVLADGSGLRLARGVKRDPALRGTSVIVLTRRSGPLDVLRGALSRCDVYLVKPVSMQTLREAVGRCMRRSLAETAPRGLPQLAIA